LFFCFFVALFFGWGCAIKFVDQSFLSNIFNIQNLADFSKTLAKTLVEFTQEKQFCPKSFPNCFVNNFILFF